MVNQRPQNAQTRAAFLSRALKVLSAFGDGKPEWGVRELAAELQMHPASVGRILRAIAMEGYLHQDGPRGAYQVGLELCRLSAIVQQTFPLIRIARPIMRELVREAGETVLLGIYDAQGMSVSFVAQIECEKPFRYVVPLGKLSPLHAGSSSRAVLAFLDRQVIESVLAKPLERFTDRTIVDPGEIRKVLSEIRRCGYSVSRGEVIEGGVGIAAPVWDYRGVIGFLNMTVPEIRYKAGMKKVFGAKVKSAAMQLSSALGKRAEEPLAEWPDPTHRRKGHTE